MIINEITLTETIDNLFIDDVDKRKKYAQQVYDLLQQSYKSIGGIKGSGLDSPEAMIQKIPMWKIHRRGDEVTGAMLYKDKNGRKRVASGTNGSRDGKQFIGKAMAHEVTSGRAYAEISGPSLKFHLKILGDALYDYAVPFEKVKEILPNDEFEQIDEYRYKRKIKGEFIEKLMIGKPGTPIT